MANTQSALKNVRQTKVRTERNRVIKTRMKTLRKKVDAAAGSGDSATALKALSEFTSAVDKAAKKNILHKNTAANLKSKAAKAIKPA